MRDTLKAPARAIISNAVMLGNSDTSIGFLYDRFPVDFDNRCPLRRMAESVGGDNAWVPRVFFGDLECERGDFERAVFGGDFE